jgi:predicted metalloendopeptidase
MMNHRCAAAVLFVAAAVTFGGAQARKSGLDLSTLDRSIRPQDDLYGFANGGWLKTAEIPADRVNYGTFTELSERTEDDLRIIIENLKGRGGPERQIRDLYASVIDVEGVEARGMAALTPGLRRIDAIDSIPKLAEECGRLSSIGAGGPFAASAGVDARNPGQIIVQVTQGGTLLPDREYYLKRDAASEEVRRAYVAYLETIFRHTNRPDGPALARAVLALETKLATAQTPQAETRTDLSDDVALTMKQLRERMPGFDWESWGKPQGFNRAARLVLGQPSFFQAFSEQAVFEPLETWRAWLAARYITASAPYVNRALHDARFEFFGRVLTGQQEPRPRWKQGVAHVNLYLGDAIGKLYVERHFPDSSRRRVQALVDNILQAFRDSVKDTEWMSDGTRRQALSKLSRLETRIGYPDFWRSYERLEIKADDLLGNVQRGQKLENDYRMVRLVRRNEPRQWVITPQTVNATYLPWRNEMILPAAMLQPPLFDPEAEDAVNYGGIGTIIGHEIGHAFDQRGRRFDPGGSARDWWTPRDEEEFQRRARVLVAQYNRYIAAPGVRVNGEATLIENIGDLGGLAMALRAYRLSLRGAEPPVIDGFTGEQRLLIRWAQLWRTRTRDEYVRQSALIQHHAPPQYRANGAAVNVDAFYTAFTVRPGDKLFLPPDKRVRIW